MELYAMEQVKKYENLTAEEIKKRINDLREENIQLEIKSEKAKEQKDYLEIDIIERQLNVNMIIMSKLMLTLDARNSQEPQH